MTDVMASQTVERIAETLARARVVYDLLRSGATWPQWSPIDAFELERPGNDEPEGGGAIRVLRSARYVMCEEIARPPASAKAARAPSATTWRSVGGVGQAQPSIDFVRLCRNRHAHWQPAARGRSRPLGTSTDVSESVQPSR